MKKSRLLTAAIILICVCCLLAVLTGWFLYALEGEINTLYGPASDDLSLRKRLYLSAQLYLQTQELTTALNQQAEEQSFLIQPDQSTLEISLQLQAQGLIANAEALQNYLAFSGLDRTLQVGEHRLSARMNAIEIAQALQDATPSEIVFQILAGWRLEEIAAALPTSGLEFSPESFFANVYAPAESLSIQEELPEKASLEGFLFPDSYQLARKVSIDEFLQTILLDFHLKVDHSLQNGFQDQQLTLFQAVTLASIVQREAVVSEEMPLIASVFFNRLENGMKLDSDPSVQYALGYISSQKSWWKNPLTLDDLQIDSPYNTYRYKGLPPGPICNPGLNAMRAVAFPADTPYYYFRAACDGSGRHSFSITFEEHSAKVCP